VEPCLEEVREECERSDMTHSGKENLDNSRNVINDDLSGWPIKKLHVCLLALLEYTKMRIAMQKIRRPR